MKICFDWTIKINSCKNYKQILNTKFVEDFQDYMNGDFHLIKKKDNEQKTTKQMHF